MLLESKQPQIDALCQKHAVKKLELFGSAARGDFCEPTSDFEFFVEFLSYDSPTIADQWFGLQEDLEQLLGRKVDLVSRRAVTNPYFLQVADPHAVAVYNAHV